MSDSLSNPSLPKNRPRNDLFPLVVYYLICLALAFLLVPMASMIGLTGKMLIYGFWGFEPCAQYLISFALGLLPNCIVLAVLSDRIAIRSILLYSVLLMSTYFQAVLSLVFFCSEVPKPLLASLMIRGFQIPSLILLSGIPLLAVRNYFNVYLSRDSAQPKPTVRVEALFLWTTCVACLIYCYQATREIQIGPGTRTWMNHRILALAVCSAVFSITTLPLAFGNRDRWWRLPAIIFISTTCSTACWYAITTWWFVQFKILPGSAITFTLTVVSLQTVGLYVLRKSGLRFVHFSRDSNYIEVDLEKRDRRIARLWTLGYLSIAAAAAGALAVFLHFNTKEIPLPFGL